jgi:[histone H3]-trimethyl-L-lysine9/36 demethylase
MDGFVRRLQPDRYELWLEGRDVGEHPENPGHKVPAPPPDGGILRRGYFFLFI